MDGKFIVFEGIDGSGKTTIADRLHKQLSDKFLRHARLVSLLKEPSEGRFGEAIRELLSRNAKLTQLEWLEYFMADRRDNLQHRVGPILVTGGVVLQDRYYYSTAAYQSSNGIDEHSYTDIIQLHEENPYIKPDLIIYLSISVEHALDRLKNRKGNDGFDRKEVMERASGNYNNMFGFGEEDFLPGDISLISKSIDGVRVLRVDASQREGTIIAAIRYHLKSILPWWKYT